MNSTFKFINTNNSIRTIQHQKGDFKNTLIDFTRYLQELAVEFNVQVFITTHSKECIDAFIQNQFKNDEITAYLLQNNNGQIQCKYIEGSRLERLIETINFDIRL